MNLTRMARLTYCQWRRLRALNTIMATNTATSGATRPCCRHMNTSTDHQQYEEAVEALNSLQSNFSVIQKVHQGQTDSKENLSLMERYLRRVGVTLDDLDKLSVIHVAGTKGKGSTCAFTERILREHGYSTGFFSSPHLVAVRERIRINGQPMPKDEFVKHFWDVYNQLAAAKEDPDDMPSYFKFLTVLALKVFLREGVDVAVLEVGIGGEYDCTNIVRRPVVCGVTMLDYDHTNMLGTSIQSIAWHKAGIMKPVVPTFTVDQPLHASLPVLAKRAAEKKCEVYVVPPLESYGWGARPLQLGLAGSVQYCNASLALQMARYWISHNTKKGSGEEGDISTTGRDHTGLSVAAPYTLSDEEVCGLQSVVWPGRSQVITRGSITFFIDGAHTSGSMQACVDWFLKTVPLHQPQDPAATTYRVLIFNSTGDRDPGILLQHLVSCNFDLAVFTTNLVTTSMSASSDQTNYTLSVDTQHLRCERQRKVWINLVRQLHKTSSQDNTERDEAMRVCDDIEDEVTPNIPATDVPTITFSCIQDTLAWLSCGKGSNQWGEQLTPPAFPPPRQLLEATEVQVLVTGSLHLVGGVLGQIDPGLSCAAHTCTAQPKPSSLTHLVLSSYGKFSSPGAP